jgi:hypothetical protein
VLPVTPMREPARPLAPPDLARAKRTREGSIESRSASSSRVPRNVFRLTFETTRAAILKRIARAHCDAKRPPGLLMKLSQFVLPAIAAAILVPSAFSFLEQGQGGTLPPPFLNQLYPGVYSNANFKKILPCEANGNLNKDAVVIVGTTAKLLIWPEVLLTSITLRSGVNDIAVLPGDTNDEILTVSADGLQSFERVGDAWTITTIRDSSSFWANASFVVSGEFDGNPGPDIAGIAANGNQVLLLYNDGSGGFTSDASFTMPTVTGVYSMDVLNFRETGDVPGTDELAISTFQGPCVAEADGTATLLKYASTSARVYMAPVKSTGSVTHRVACIAALSGTDWLTLWTDGAANEGPYSFGPAGVIAVGSGDADNDGDVDLFATRSTENKFSFYRYDTGDSPTIDKTEVQKFDFGPQGRNPATMNPPCFAVADFDSNDFLDVLAPSEGGAYGGHTYFGCITLVQLGISDPSDWFVGVSNVKYFPDTNRLRIRLTAPEAVIPGAVLRVLAYHAADLNAPPEIEPWQQDDLTLPTGTGTVDYFLQLPEGYSIYVSQDMFPLVMTQVVLSNGVVVERSPAMTGCFGADPSFDVVSIAAETVYFMATDRENDSADPAGGWSEGPDVPSSDPEEQPKEEKSNP